MSLLTSIALGIEPLFELFCSLLLLQEQKASGESAVVCFFANQMPKL
jgi:hypothetical protein